LNLALKILASSLSSSTKKKHVVILLSLKLHEQIHCFCVDTAIYLVLHGASKIQNCAAS
jgi:hypothetical protein